MGCQIYKNVIFGKKQIPQEDFLRDLDVSFLSELEEIDEVFLHLGSLGEDLIDVTRVSIDLGTAAL